MKLQASMRTLRLTCTLSALNASTVLRTALPSPPAAVQGIPSSCPQSAHLCASTPAGSEASYPIEHLFHLYGVDLALFGHVHDYELFWPTYNLTAHPGCTGRGLHRNPSATVHVTTGEADGSAWLGNPDTAPQQLRDCRAQCTLPVDASRGTLG